MAMNAMQTMLKSMGLNDAFEGVQKLISSGAIEKIIEFADAIGEINERLIQIERELSRLSDNISSKQRQTDLSSGNAGNAGGNVNGRYSANISTVGGTKK